MTTCIVEHVQRFFCNVLFCSEIKVPRQGSGDAGVSVLRSYQSAGSSQYNLELIVYSEFFFVV